MAEQASVQWAIEAASTLKELVSRLLGAYSRFPTIIEREQRAIAASDFAEVQLTCAEKVAVGNEIEQDFAALITVGERLGRLACEVLVAPMTRPVSLSDCVQIVVDITAFLTAKDPQALGPQVLAHLAKGLAAQLVEFKDRYREIKPRLEANRYLVGTMLNNLQESYRFWQEINERATAAYDATGQQQVVGRLSGFKATA